MSALRERFYVDGVGCWCPGEMSLYQLRVMGHTETCTQARIGWRANNAQMTEIQRERAIDAEAGRQIREAAAETLSRAAEGER